MGTGVRERGGEKGWRRAQGEGCRGWRRAQGEGGRRWGFNTALMEYFEPDS